MRKNVKIIIVFAILFILFAIYLLIKENGNAKETDKTSEQVIINIAKEKIEKLTFLIEKEERCFIKKGDQWSLEQDSEFPVNSEQMQILTDALMDVKASREIKKPKDLEAFGLLEPINKVIVTTSEETVLITIGNINSVTGDCYIYLNNDADAVYMVDSDLATVFGGGLMNYAKETPFPTIVGNNIADIQIKHGDNVYHIKQNENSSTGWYLVKKDQSQEEVALDSVTAIQSTIAGLTFANYYDYRSEDLSKYGLDQPFAVLTVMYQISTSSTSQTDATDTPTESQLKIVIGNEDGNGNRYVQLNDSKEVHSISIEAINNLLKI